MSVIETIVYVGILGIVMIFITNSLIRVVSTYQHARAEREVLSNARLMMETINKHISYAQEVYAPTSRFNTNEGQISLITSRDAPPEHATVFFDAWSDGNQLLVRNEGYPIQISSLSSAAVRVTQFRIERIFQGLGREALKVTLSVASNALPMTASTTLNSTTALRGSY